jgi:hypothetical protein
VAAIWSCSSACKPRWAALTSPPRSWKAGARDWQTQLAIAHSHVGSAHQLQFHHISPKALLKRSGYNTREIDDIANLAFIG